MVAAGALVFSTVVAAAVLHPGSATAGTVRTANGRAGTGAGTGAGVGVGVGVTSVEVDRSTVRVVGQLGPGADPAGTEVAVYALDVSQDPSSYTSISPVATVSPTGLGTFVASVPRDQGGTDLYNDKFLAVARTSSGDTVLGTAVYPTAVRFGVPDNYPYPHTRSIKGLADVPMTDDGEQLGIQHADVNVVLDWLMLSGPGAPGTYLTFQSGGATYYFDKAQVASLDQQVRSLTENGAVVSLILILYADNAPTSAARELIFPGADQTQGVVFPFNTKTAEGVRYVRAAFQFLASRYERADAKYGRADDFIVGNEVDAAWVWQNMGDQTLSNFVEYYGRALRMMYLAAREYYPYPRVYVSMENHWGQSANPSLPLRAYPGKDLMDTLESTERSEGDFPWGVAYHPYPENLFNPASWNDADATNSFGSPFITFKNIQELPAYMQQPQFLFHGQQRHIILSEEGCNTPSDSLADQQLQAACYAYAYYKIFFAGGIDAFNYHRLVDHPLEGGLRLGLWSWDPRYQANGSNLPGSPKYIYNVFKYIDTSRSLEVTKFALPIIGISSWKQVIPNFDPSRLAAQPIPQQVNAGAGEQPVNETVLADFADGTDGWRASDNANAVQDLASSGPAPGTGLLRVHFDSGLSQFSTDAKVWKGADVVFTHPLNACAEPHLNMDLRIPAPSAGQFQSGTTFQAEIRAYGPAGQVAYGMDPVDASGQWSQLSLDLSQWSGCRSVNRIKVWVHASSDDQWPGSFDIAQVGMSGAVKPARGHEAVADTHATDRTSRSQRTAGSARGPGKRTRIIRHRAPGLLREPRTINVVTSGTGH